MTQSFVNGSGFLMWVSNFVAILSNNVDLSFKTLFSLIGWYGFMELIEILILGFSFGI
jgi:hypothetical protein